MTMTSTIDVAEEFAFKHPEILAFWHLPHWIEDDFRRDTFQSRLDHAALHCPQLLDCDHRILTLYGKLVGETIVIPNTTTSPSTVAVPANKPKSENQITSAQKAYRISDCGNWIEETIVTHFNNEASKTDQKVALAKEFYNRLLAGESFPPQIEDHLESLFGDLLDV